MEIVRLEENLREIAQKAAEVVRAGGVVLYPTDTLYALGADALSNEAVAKVREIKGRDVGKPVHCIVVDLEMAGAYGVVDGNASALAHAFLPGPLTLILKKKENITAGIARGMDTIGIRIPKSDFSLEMAKSFGGPITTTSANLSGQEPEMSVEGILSQLGHNAQLIDLIVDDGELPMSKPSTVVDVSHPEAVILREGAVAAEEVWEVIHF